MTVIKVNESHHLSIVSGERMLIVHANRKSVSLSIDGALVNLQPRAALLLSQKLAEFAVDTTERAAS
jgi:hypothetical protein